MCGIAGFVANDAFTQTEDVSWIAGLARALDAAPAGETEALKPCLDDLFARFARLMSFSTYAELAEAPANRASAEGLGAALRRHEQALLELSAADGVGSPEG